MELFLYPEFFTLACQNALIYYYKGNFVFTAPMSVKEVLQSLVDDNLVNSEKVGSSSYYWAFKSQVLNVKQNKLKELKKQLDETEQKIKTVEKNVAHAKSERQECVSFVHAFGM